MGAGNVCISLLPRSTMLEGCPIKWSITAIFVELGHFIFDYKASTPRFFELFTSQNFYSFSLHLFWSFLLILRHNEWLRYAFSSLRIEFNSLTWLWDLLLVVLLLFLFNSWYISTSTYNLATNAFLVCLLCILVCKSHRA